MNKESRQFMACGACGIVIDENGRAEGPFDRAALAARRVAGLFGGTTSKRKASSVAHA